MAGTSSRQNGGKNDYLSVETCYLYPKPDMPGALDAYVMPSAATTDPTAQDVL